jgi:hypothetical protein
MRRCNQGFLIRDIGKYPFVGLCAHRDKDYRIGSNVSKFYLIEIGFILGELVSLVKMFRLFKLEQMFSVFKVWTQ